MLIQHLLRQFVRRGELLVVTADGRSHHFGGLPLEGFVPVTVRFLSPWADIGVALHPDRYLGEAYMRGALVLERGSIYDLLALCAENLRREKGNGMLSTMDWVNQAVRRFQQVNPMPRALRNVASHYDRDADFYKLFLDRDMQYSCAYFARPGMTLEEAQEEKKRRLIAKLLLEPGAQVLDIGCGFGGLALSCAEAADVAVTGITLSREQLRVARDRGAANVRFELHDYREQEGQFDRIVSVGMFEHVGSAHYRGFFRRLAHLLAPDGIAVVHAIGRVGPPRATSAFVRRHIFPGGAIPALSEVFAASETSGLIATDLEILHLHYAETLRHWAQRFQQHRTEAERLYEAPFCRMWEYWLAAAEVGFRFLDLAVFQLQLVHHRQAVPMSRDYMCDRPALARDADPRPLPVSQPSAAPAAGAEVHCGGRAAKEH